MKKIQRFVGVGDSKPASASLSTSPNASYLAATPAASTSPYDAGSPSANHLLPPTSQSASVALQQPQYASRQVSPQSSQSMLHSPAARASPQPHSPSAQQQYFDIPPRAVSPAALSPQPVSPLAPPSSSADVHLVERPDLHKSLKALETLLVNLDEYRDLSARLAKVQKRLAKSASDLERNKVVLDTPSQTLHISSTMFDGLADVASRHAKHIQKEYEALNDACAKYFKKVAKEERAHDDYLATLDAKIKKANLAHDKNVKKASGTRALESHDKYIATVQALTNDVSRAKNAHALSMAAKSHVASLLVASTLGGLADVDFKHRCESIRRVGPHIGRLNHLLCFTSSEFMPALHHSELEEAQQGQADYLASLAAQVEAQVVAQAHINAKINEDTQTILRAQEMGWRPPSPLAPPNAAFHNLARSTSINSNASRTSATPATSSSTLQQPQPQTGTRSRAHSSATANEPPPAVSASLSPAPLADNDAASVHSVATDRTPRQVEASAERGVARLDRAPTGSTMKSMAAQPETWEAASIAASRSGDAASPPHGHDRTDTSAHEGSVVDKLAVPREDSDAAPSLSASHSAQGSDDGTRIPRTPDDSEALPALHADRAKPALATAMRPAQRALESYREQSNPTDASRDASSAIGRSDSVYSSSSQSAPGPVAASQTTARKLSLWERERERMRQLDNDPASRPSSALYSTSSSHNNGSGWTRSKPSESVTSDRSSGSQIGMGLPRPATGAEDADRYAPAVGSTRLSATGVTRSLSTDTTASERSFVARMKARYQAEKELEREQRQLNVLEKERAARRATMDPALSLPSLGGARSGAGGSGGRVPEIASRYQMSGTSTYAQEVPARRYHESLPAGSRLSASSTPSTSGVDEFGGLRQTRPEAAHSDVCGCHQCSARHYGSGTTRVERTERPREYNVRRTSMPVPARTGPVDAPRAKQQAIYSSSPARDEYTQYAYRPTQQHAFANAPTRSYDDSPPDAARRVAFAREPQSIR
ncbi:hypothetical protein PANT_20c00013 [Moesziomyces antarcticus T-34]|uniref:Uncharacterized protein n=1 Tax=Pseudozyma antarctica (strain T-34) TaxID=1151754 RepID=M9MHM5_PSEA3|nr:hypothetical protein PANT_20c00013 [Moesziomyces antarcticus T-34]